MDGFLGAMIYILSLILVIGTYSFGLVRGSEIYSRGSVDIEIVLLFFVCLLSILAKIKGQGRMKGPLLLPFSLILAYICFHWLYL